MNQQTFYLAFVAALALSTSAAQASKQCQWTNAAGSVFFQLYFKAFEWVLQRTDGSVIVCESFAPELGSSTARISCNNGYQGEIFSAASTPDLAKHDLLSFNGEIWRRDPSCKAILPPELEGLWEEDASYCGTDRSTDPGWDTDAIEFIASGTDRTDVWFTESQGEGGNCILYDFEGANPYKISANCGWEIYYEPDILSITLLENNTVLELQFQAGNMSCCRFGGRQVKLASLFPRIV